MVAFSPTEQRQQLIDALDAIEKRLGYCFSNRSHILEAFTHRSFVNEYRAPTGETVRHNERLELLGDAVLHLVTTEKLFTLYPNASEGELSRRKAGILCRTSCAYLMRRLQIGSYLLVGRGEKVQGARSEESLFANLFEALLGAIYLDGGLPPVQALFSSLAEGLLSGAEEVQESNWKAQLQEMLVQLGKGTPEYHTISEKGPGHQRIFEVAIISGQEELGRGEGSSKKAAEQQAAKHAIERMFLK